MGRGYFKRAVRRHPVATALLFDFVLTFAPVGIYICLGPTRIDSALGRVPRILILALSIALTACMIKLARALTRLALHVAIIPYEELQLEDTREPVLLLRSFRDDGLYVKSTVDSKTLFQSRPARLRLEEIIADEMKSLGPTVALSDPLQHRPRLGANRIRAKDGWRTTVEELFGKSRLIIMVASSTASLQWEFRRIIELGYFNKLYIMMPVEDPLKRMNRWFEFLDEFQLHHKVATSSIDWRTVLGLLPYGDVFRAVYSDENLMEFDFQGFLKIVRSCAFISSLGKPSPLPKVLDGSVIVPPPIRLEKQLVVVDLLERWWLRSR
jgi:hypothetical protein